MIYNTQIIDGSVPSKSNCYRIVTISGHGALTKTDKLKKYEESFNLQCNYYRNLGINSLFEIHLDVYYQNNRSDLDNSLKVILDCLQKVGAIENDNKCIKIVANKFIDKLRPRVEFNLVSID